MISDYFLFVSCILMCKILPKGVSVGINLYGLPIYTIYCVIMTHMLNPFRSPAIWQTAFVSCL